MGERVFRPRADGGLEFVGDFEGLYRDEADPWAQSGSGNDPMSRYYAKARENLIDAIGQRQGKGLEVGCGHGHVTSLLTAKTGMQWDGLDISETAVAKARAGYPDLTFFAGDIRNHGPGGAYDIVLLNQVLWYVIDRMDEAVESSLKLLNKGGSLIIAQAFLRGEQKYAAEIANGFCGLVDLFLARYSGRLRLIAGRHEIVADLAHNDGILIFAC